MKAREKKVEIKKHADKFKEANVGPWRYLLSIVAFLATLFLLPAVFKGSRSFWDGLSWFYLIVAALATLIDVIQGRIPLRITVIFGQFISYVMRILMEVLLIILALPVMALFFIMGPVMFFVFFVSLAMVLAYFVEVILGIDVRGIVVSYDGYTALAALVALPISGYVFYRAIKAENLMDSCIEKIVDVFLFINKLGRRDKPNPGDTEEPVKEGK